MKTKIGYFKQVAILGRHTQLGTLSELKWDSNGFSPLFFLVPFFFYAKMKKKRSVCILLILLGLTFFLFRISSAALKSQGKHAWWTPLAENSCSPCVERLFASPSSYLWLSNTIIVHKKWCGLINSKTTTAECS